MQYLLFFSACSLTLSLIAPAHSMKDDNNFDNLKILNHQIPIKDQATLPRYNFFYGNEHDIDKISAVYTSQNFPNYLPCMPYFAPYHPNGEELHNTRDNVGIIHFPLVMRLPGDFESNLPESLQSLLHNDKLTTDKICIGIVAQDIPFIESTELCFRPHTYLYPTVAAENLGNESHQKDIYTGIFESEKKQDNQVKFVKRINNQLGKEEVKVHQEKEGINTVLSPNNMFIEGVSHKKPASFYTYTTYDNDKKSAVICLHILMNDEQTKLLYSTLGEFIKEDTKVLSRTDFLSRLEQAEHKPFEGYEGLKRIINLLQKPKIDLVQPHVLPASPVFAPAGASPRMTPDSPISVASPIVDADGIALVGFNVGDVLWDRKGKENIFSKEKLSVEVIQNSINLKATPPVVDVTFRLKDTDQMHFKNVELLPQKGSFVLQEEEKYDRKKNKYLKKYIDELSQNPIKGIQQFWSKEVDVEGIGIVNLIFQRDRDIRYYKTKTNESWSLQHDKEFGHKSVISIPYGFEGEEATNIQEIFTMEHAEQPVEHSNIWFLDGQRWLRRVKSVEYTTIHPRLVGWAQDNEILEEKYSKLEHGEGEMFVVYPPSGTAYPILDLIPEGNALNQYYLFNNEYNHQALNYIYYDNDRGLFKPQGSLFSCYVQEMKKDELKFNFENKNSWYNYLYTIKQSSNSIILPPKTGSRGQVVKDKEFKKGFYRLLDQQQSANDITQTWVEEPQNGESVVIRFSDVR